jgi:hypothetical protein
MLFSVVATLASAVALFERAELTLAKLAVAAANCEVVSSNLADNKFISWPRSRFPSIKKLFWSAGLTRPSVANEKHWLIIVANVAVSIGVVAIVCPLISPKV